MNIDSSPTTPDRPAGLLYNIGTVCATVVFSVTVTLAWFFIAAWEFCKAAWGTVVLGKSFREQMDNMDDNG